MSLHESIKAELKESLKAKDAIRLRTVRSMLTAFTNELVSSGRTPQDWLQDEETLAVIKRLAKQRKESISQFEANDRPELAVPEKEELVVLEGYLPQLMSQADIKPIAEAKKAELGIEDKSKLGMLVGAVMKELAGKADGGDVKVVVRITLLGLGMGTEKFKPHRPQETIDDILRQLDQGEIHRGDKGFSDVTAPDGTIIRYNSTTGEIAFTKDGITTTAKVQDGELAQLTHTSELNPYSDIHPENKRVRNQYLQELIRAGLFVE